MTDIWVVVWQVDYEGQSVCGAYQSKRAAEARIAELVAEDKDISGELGWIRCMDGEPVETSNQIDIWDTWNRKHGFWASRSRGTA